MEGKRYTVGRKTKLEKFNIVIFSRSQTIKILNKVKENLHFIKHNFIHGQISKKSDHFAKETLCPCQTINLIVV